MLELRFTLALALLIAPMQGWTLICSRYPQNTYTPKSPVDENFVIAINGNPQTYILGQDYNVSLNAYNGLRFVSFILTLENDNGDTNHYEDFGHFEVTDSVETRYSPRCINTVESTNSNPKTRVDVVWVAPAQPGSGCILIRATVLQHRDVWYMDDGGLTKRVCEEVVDDVESQSTAVERQPCCACDEARYELTFEGLWSRNVHPKDFPAKGWITRFSDIVGAAHVANYRFWEYGMLATEAMQEFAEHGSVRLLEREFSNHFKQGHIRTIIKARGPAYPHLNGQSVASIRADPVHHLVSLASKLEPSPDWIVGVSGLELCMPNCTWLEEKVINLYPWDVGTDGGASYTSADQPQIPHDVIRRMRSDYPNDPRSPFFDPTGAPMKPLATLTVRKQRSYERLCENEDSNNIDVPRECVTHPWSPWTPCSARCGEGSQRRMRVYKQPAVAQIYNCDLLMVNRQDRLCTGETCTDGDSAMWEEAGREDNAMFTGGEADATRAECQLSSWGQWSECNRKCGEGRMMRRRQYLNPNAETKCQNTLSAKMYEYKNCFGRVCLGEISGNGRRFEEEEAEGNADELYRGREVVEAEPMDTADNNQQILNNYPPWYSEAASAAEQPSYGDQSNNNNNNNNNDYGLEPQAPNNDHEVEVDVDRHNDPFEVGNQSMGLSVEHEPHKNRYGMTPPARPAQWHRLNEHNARQYQQEVENAAERLEPSELSVPSYCFQPLHIYTCLNTTIVGNFWFYHYCADECMLYAADACDENENKFRTLNMCELRCRQPGNAELLRRKQLSDCQSGAKRRRTKHRRTKQRRTKQQS